MPHGNGVHAYEGGEGRIQDVPLDRHAPDGVGPVQDEEGDSRLPGRFHGQGHGVHIGVVAGAHVLDVEEEDVQAFQHGRRGLSGLTVEGVDGQPCPVVPPALDDNASLGVSPDAVLGGEEGHQLHGRLPRQPVDARHPAAVDPCVVGDEARAKPPYQVQGVGEEDLHAGSDRMGQFMEDESVICGRLLTRRGVPVGPACRESQEGEAGEEALSRSFRPHNFVS